MLITAQRSFAFKRCTSNTDNLASTLFASWKCDRLLLPFLRLSLMHTGGTGRNILSFPPQMMTYCILSQPLGSSQFSEAEIRGTTSSWLWLLLFLVMVAQPLDGEWKAKVPKRLTRLDFTGQMSVNWPHIRVFVARVKHQRDIAFASQRTVRVFKRYQYSSCSQIWLKFIRAGCDWSRNWLTLDCAPDLGVGPFF